MICRAGYAATRSDVTDDICGIAAPVQLGRFVVGGVSLVFAEAVLKDADPGCFAKQVNAADAAISKRLAADRSLVPR